MARNFNGILHLNNEPHFLLLQQMCDAINYSGAYHISVKRTSQFYAANLHSTKINHSKQTSFRPSNSKLSVVSFSSLIEKDALKRKLGLGNEDYEDEQLITISYEKWGYECVHHLIGDWAFALWDEDLQVLLLARNPYAEGTIFYSVENGGIYFSSMLAALITLDEIPKKVNHEKFYQECLKLNVSGNESIYHGIFMLQPGHYATFSRNGLKTCQYWFLSEKVPALIKKDSHGEELFYLFEKAVTQSYQLSPSWVFSLSGGKDSTALIMMINHLMGDGQKLKAVHYSEVLPDHQKIKGLDDTGESHLLNLTTKELNNIELTLSESNESLHEFAENFTNKFRIPPFTINQKYISDLARKIAQLGGHMAMNAQGGNETISYEGISPYYSFSQLIADKKQGYTPDFSDFIKAGFGSVRGFGKRCLIKNWIHFVVDQQTALNRDFIESVNGYELLEDHLYTEIQYGASPSKNYYLQKLRPSTHNRLGGWNMLGSAYNIQFIDPTVNTELVQFIYACPNFIFNSKGQSKNLYRSAFNKIVSNKFMKTHYKWPNMTAIQSLYLNDIEAIKDQFDKNNNLSHVLDRKKIDKMHHSMQSLQWTAKTHYQLWNRIGSILQALYIKT